MNSRTSPPQPRAGGPYQRRLPISPGTPRWPSSRPPFCLWGSSSLPRSFRHLPLPSPPLPGPWDGRSRGRVVWRGTRFGAGKGEEGAGGTWRRGVSSRESPEVVATAGNVAVGWRGSRPSLRKPGKWVGGRGKVVTGSGESRCSKAHTFKGILSRL